MYKYTERGPRGVGFVFDPLDILYDVAPLGTEFDTLNIVLGHGPL